MSEVETETGAISPVERDLASLKAALARPVPDLQAIVRDYLVPILEGQREEYVGGFEALEARVEEAVESSGTDGGFLLRIIQALGALGGLADQAMQRAGFADAQGTPLPGCPDELKIAFGGAQSLAGALAAEIKEMQTDDDADDGTAAN